MATATATVPQSAITLRGSADTVAEFFGYSINSVLFQRGLYESSSFTRQLKYGLGLQVTADPALTSYLNGVLAQLRDWLNNGEVKKLVLVIAKAETEEVLERWVFNVENERPSGNGNDVVAPKSDAGVQKEIAAILRQITASTSFLPLLDCLCTFDLLVYTPADISTPGEWEESDPRAIGQAAEVQLRSFSTQRHKINTTVAYKLVDFADV